MTRFTLVAGKKKSSKKFLEYKKMDDCFVGSVSAVSSYSPGVGVYVELCEARPKC